MPNSKVIQISDEAFKIVIFFEISGNNIDISETEFTISLKDKKITLKSTDKDIPISCTNFLTLTIETYKHYLDAEKDMIKIDQALKISSLEHHIGIISERYTHTNEILNTILNNIENNVFHQDIIFKKRHGKGIYPYNAPEFDSNSSQDYEKINSKEFFKSFLKYYTCINTQLDISNSIDMLNTIKFEYSSNVKLVMSMTVIEMLAEQRVLRKKEEIELIDTFIQTIEKSSLDINQKESLSKALFNCKYYSINNLCKKLIKTKLGKKRVNDFRNLYDYRSKILHTGNIHNAFNEEAEKQELSREFQYAEKAYSLAKDLIDKCILDYINS